LDVKAKKLEFLDYRSSEMIIVTDNLDDLSLIDNAGEAIIVSKRQNIGNWNKLLKTHPNFRIEPV
jgi:phosphoserine phosphatase